MDRAALRLASALDLFGAAVDLTGDVFRLSEERHSEMKLC